ncbi:MAG: alkaline phosphatase family protein [Halanaerobiales bacterium]|nr:alkaline phosphatase family protein [Halanaerobiales bacterium]
MKIAFYLILLVFLPLLFLGFPVKAGSDSLPAGESPQLVVLFMLDGFRPDYLAMYDLPVIESLVKMGVYYAEATGVFPSTTTTNQTSLVTGAYPARTGIPNNSKYDRKADRIVTGLRDVKVPVISEILKSAGHKTVVLAHFMLENKGEEVYLERGVAQFKTAIAQYRPQLLVYYEGDTDSYGHKYGPYSEEMEQKLIEIDTELGEMLSYLEQLGLREQTTVIIASDHGMTLNTQPAAVPHLKELLAGSGFKIALNNAEITAETDLVVIQSGSSFLYFREGRIDQRSYQSLLEELSGIPGLDLLTAREIEALNADPKGLGDLVLVPRPGFSILGGGGGGIHGRPEEAQITLIMAGAGIKEGLVKSEAEIIDITPTILELLGIEIPASVQGRVLKGALKEKPIEWDSYF